MLVMDNKFYGLRIAISGVRGSGKTTFLIDLVKKLTGSGLEVQGVLEAGIFEDDKKVAIEVIDLAAGESRILARLSTEETTKLQFGDWTFFPEAFEWANERLMETNNPDVFILDEVGPLELRQGMGLQAGLKVMTSKTYGLGIMTVRPKCLTKVNRLFPDAKTYSLNRWGKEPLLNELFRIASHI
jgi:nucleoside-triphosphatase THEP1